MGKRCETVKNGQLCDYLAEDGTCLLKVEELVHKCPARETVKNEHKDDWMNDIESLSGKLRRLKPNE